MLFREFGGHPLTTTSALPLWLPVETGAALSPVMTHVRTLLEGRVRHLASSTLQLALEFNRTLDERTTLQHDCKVFAYAHAQGHAMQARSFYGASSDTMLPPYRFTSKTYLERGEQIPRLAGSIIALLAVVDGRPTTMNEHFMVQVSDDLHPPLYASKLGVSGPVVVHDLAAIREHYTNPVALGIEFAQ